ncbi:hypothetical protein EPA93_13815 [Ktedonosporobacter rubrisoli]|uniref:YtkA-like domain-containing protein n=1 Tax=Ktedonosporobacter rubrisoli TaxID=2509675 RepID=A0A4P6JP97_KTERU|nr:hypothetical protein [Ktedonosporobacter rubrisoli]QBD77023.1 hypothetical protein EPA93_13815 [Ktedonosporobacter rubrisoli]
MRHVFFLITAFLIALGGAQLPAMSQSGTNGTPAPGYQGITAVHQEKVKVGPYTVTTGFSDWPMHADRSLDIIFIPDGGIADKHGTVTLISPSGQEIVHKLQRHPRMYEDWGLSITVLPEEGPWTFLFEIDGPLGHGVGRLAPIMLLERPGPPILLSWLVGLLPLYGLIALIIWAWLKVQPKKFSQVWSWS